MSTRTTVETSDAVDVSEERWSVERVDARVRRLLSVAADLCVRSLLEAVWLSLLLLEVDEDDDASRGGVAV